MSACSRQTVLMAVEGDCGHALGGMLHLPQCACRPSCRQIVYGAGGTALQPANAADRCSNLSQLPHRELTDAGVEGGSFLTKLFIRAIEQKGTDAALVGKLLYAAAELGALQVGCSSAAGARAQAWIQAGCWAVWAAVVC